MQIQPSRRCRNSSSESRGVDSMDESPERTVQTALPDPFSIKPTYGAPNKKGTHGSAGVPPAFLRPRRPRSQEFLRRAWARCVRNPGPPDAPRPSARAALPRTCGACNPCNRHNIGGIIHAHGHSRAFGACFAHLCRGSLMVHPTPGDPFSGLKGRQIDSSGRSPEKAAPGLSSSICTSPIARSRNPPSQ